MQDPEWLPRAPVAKRKKLALSLNNEYRKKEGIVNMYYTTILILFIWMPLRHYLAIDLVSLLQKNSYALQLKEWFQIILCVIHAGRRKTSKPGLLNVIECVLKILFHWIYSGVMTRNWYARICATLLWKHEGRMVNHILLLR